MTIINPNSISGITSITSQGNNINFYRSDGTLAGLELGGVNFYSTSGVSTFSSIHIGNDIRISSGIVTATTFSGSLTGNVTGNLTGNVNSSGVSTVTTISGTTATYTTFNGNVTGNVNSTTGVSTFSSGIVVAAGSTAAPSITPTGDSNTGIFFPSADTIAFGEGGAEAFRITSTGQLRATGASDVRFTLGSTGTPETNNSVHIRADGADLKFMNASGGITLFEQNGVEAARFNTSGNLAFPSGQGIDFSAAGNASGMTSELLNDYEEGTWTPAWASSGTLPTLSYSTQSGYYVKIGRVVHFWGRIFMSSWGGGGGSGNIRVSGLPFTSNSDSNHGGPLCQVTFSYTGGNAVWPTGVTQVFARVLNNATTLEYIGLGAPTTQLGESAPIQWTSNPQMYNNYFSGSYFV